jgi:hypothetical protein
VTVPSYDSLAQKGHLPRDNLFCRAETAEKPIADAQRPGLSAFPANSSKIICKADSYRLEHKKSRSYLEGMVAIAYFP